ncbi:MAG: hypothetical protein ACRDJV_12920 [Actinomycetota bacterium]
MRWGPGDCARAATAAAGEPIQSAAGHARAPGGGHGMDFDGVPGWPPIPFLPGYCEVINPAGLLRGDQL